MITTLRCCEICGDPVNFAGAVRCNGCWEAVTRLERMTPAVLAACVAAAVADRTPAERVDFVHDLQIDFCTSCGYDDCSGGCQNDE